MYTYPLSCLRVRAIILSCIAFISFLWTILLSLYIFYQWEVISKAEQSILALFLLVNVITVIMLLVLLILTFRTWLDAARCMFLLICHIGVAAAITHWKPQFQCLTSDRDEGDLCKFAATYLLITGWTVPVLIILYVTGLTFAVYRLRRLDTDYEGGGKVDDAPSNVASIYHDVGTRGGIVNQSMPPPSPSTSLASKGTASARLSKPFHTSFY